MKGIKGQLSSLPITDLMQWIEMNRKSGMLLLKRNGGGKCFCFKDGNILLASSNEDGKRFADYLTKEAHIDSGKISEGISTSREKKMPFINYLTENKIIPLEFIRTIIEQVAESVIMDILSWQEGSFHFVESLPEIIADSPIRLNTNHLVFESVRKYDEVLRQKTADDPGHQA